MAIRPEEISTDLTLELDEDEITLADFNAACEAFSGLVKEMARFVQTDAQASAWSVEVYRGSAGIGLSARDGRISLSARDQICSTLFSGFEQLSSGIRPAAFSDRALEHSRALASTFRRNSGQPLIRMWHGKDQFILIDRAIANTAKEILDPIYEEEGSIEGRLEKLSSHDKLQFVVYDLLDDRAIKCDVNESLLKEAWAHFQKRIEVTGMVRYRKDGHPVSVKAEAIYAFPEQDEIPSLDEMRRLFFTN